MNTHQDMPVGATPPARGSVPRQPLWRRVLALPSTRAGWWAVGLAAGFFGFFGVFMVLVASGQRGGDTFLDNLWLSGTMLAAGLSAIAGGVTAALAIVRRGERSLLVIAALLLGLLLLVFALGEIGGHD